MERMSSTYSLVLSVQDAFNATGCHHGQAPVAKSISRPLTARQCAALGIPYEDGDRAPKLDLKANNPYYMELELEVALSTKEERCKWMFPLTPEDASAIQKRLRAASKAQ